MNKDLFKQIFKLIKNYDEIILARHISPDPDAVGSQLALRDSIRLTFPNKKVYAIGVGVSKFKYLGLMDKIDTNSITNALLIVLDVPNYSRIDGIEDISYHDIIKIDHHPKEDIVGTVDFTSSKYSSACEMVAELLLNTRLIINKQIAEKLFIGIVSDSERFLFKNTTAHTFEMAYKLVAKFNLDTFSLYTSLYEKSFNDYLFEAYIINNMTITKNNFGYLVIDNTIFDKLKVDSASASIVVNNFNFIKDLLAWCFITYDAKNEIYKANIRSRGPIINEIASHYNGGGHQYASGARFINKEDIEKIFNELDKACQEYKEHENQ